MLQTVTDGAAWGQGLAEAQPTREVPPIATGSPRQAATGYGLGASPKVLTPWRSLPRPCHDAWPSLLHPVPCPDAS